MTQLPAVVTFLTIVLLFATTFATGRARGKYGIKAPATSGHPLYERAYRIQMNTIESTVLFLPTLWLAASHGFSGWAGIAGLVWVVGRVWYALAYMNDPARRGPGFGMGMLAWFALLIMSAVGVGRAVMLA